MSLSRPSPASWSPLRRTFLDGERDGEYLELVAVGLFPGFEEQ
jgi:hypothetical protein